jgi:ribonuclease D
MTKVTNNYTGILNVGGTDIRPGATVEIASNVFDKWRLGNAAKLWLEQGLIVSDTAVTPVENTNPPTERELLESKATGLGVAFPSDISDDDLLNAILEAEEAAKTGDREALLKEARDLGLNPNINTGVEKLKKMIADKKGA